MPTQLPEIMRFSLSLSKAHGILIVLVSLFMAAFIGWIFVSEAGKKRFPQALFQSGVKGQANASSAPTFITLSFNNAKELDVVEHNCVRLHNAGYAFEIHTDDFTQPFCKLCRCLPFETKNCSCPNPVGTACSHCNKLVFIVDLIKIMPEFILLDSDLVILDDIFIPAMVSRTTYFDFVAAYGFGKPENWNYGMHFNSGLMYMRRLDGLDYDELLDIKEELGANGDQIVVSKFVHTYYTNWDVLSLRWHCRFLDRPENSIDPANCLTFHGHGVQRSIQIPDFRFSKVTVS